jgi:hypothetical protein
MKLLVSLVVIGAVIPAQTPPVPPKPAMDLVPGTSSYQATITMGGQTVSMSITRTVKDGGARWLITENAKTPQGEATDEAEVEKGTLFVRKRTIRQGPLAVDLSFDDAKATGTISINGETKPVSVDLGGPLFADGAGANDVLARLPLAAGNSATFRNLDIQKQTVGMKQFKVIASEKVTVAAGTFDAWKAEVSSPDGPPGVTTLWIDTASRRVVKISSVRPTGSITAELQP